MRKLRILLLSLAIGGMLSVSGPLGAQPGSDDGEESVVVPMEKMADMSPQEMSDTADDLIDEMKGILKRVVELQQLARNQKDVIKLNCVNDKLLQLKQLLNIAESARTEMIEAIVNKDDGDRYHQFEQIVLVAEKVRVLRDEAEGCIGEELVFLGPTENDTEGPDITDDPTDDDGLDFETDPDIERPGYASPFL